MRPRTRTREAWLAIAARAIAVVLFFVGAGLAHRPFVAAATLVLALLLVLATLRPKAPPSPGALYSASADRIVDGGEQLPGRLSLTPNALIWLPSSYSARRGERPVEVEMWSDISLRRGPGLLDLTVIVVPVEGEPLRFWTRRSRRLERVLEGYELTREPP